MILKTLRRYPMKTMRRMGKISLNNAVIQQKFLDGKCMEFLSMNFSKMLI